MPEADQVKDEAPEEQEDEYACVSRSRLSLKKSSNMDDDGSKSKKRKRKAEREKREAPPPPSVTSSNHSSGEPQSKRTPAEIAFQKMQLKMQKKRIAQKASMTHKQRVEKFNEHLDSLTEHFDIPKVSWTK